MSYPINYPTPQGANVQIFSEGGTTSDWVKPQGASFVWFTLIGCGGTGDTTSGGTSGAVTNFMCPAFLIPDTLRISIFTGGSGLATSVIYQQKNSAGYTLLTANGGAGATSTTAMTANAFTAMGFFQSVAGQAGNNLGITASATTFLSGGGSTASSSSNYGYSHGASGTNRSGYFQMQPIIVGTGGGGTGGGGTGCGGGNVGTNPGGNGLAVIITW